MGRGGWHGGGRPRKTEDDKRQSLHDFRLPWLWIKFLKSHKRKGSLMIEKALLAIFGEDFETYKKSLQAGEQSLAGDTEGRDENQS